MIRGSLAHLGTAVMGTVVLVTPLELEVVPEREHDTQVDWKGEETLVDLDVMPRRKDTSQTLSNNSGDAG